MFEELTKKLDSFLELGTPGYDCVVYHKGRCVYRHYRGYSDFENQIPMNGKEKYYIYSCSKVITCTAALQLYEKGLFSFEDELSTYLPEFKTMYIKTENDTLQKAERQITIRDLFCMTAGFSYNHNSPMLKKCKEETQGRCTLREVMMHLAKEPLLFEPGAKWGYSFCHDVLAAVIEIITEMRFGEYVRLHIFEPMNMNASTFLPSEQEMENLCAQYYHSRDVGTSRMPNTNVYRLGTEYESGGAGCVSTVDDYIKFLEGLRTEQLLSKETLDFMSRNQLNEEQMKTYWIEGYGYGLGVRCPLGDGDISDIGWGGAAGAYPILDRKRELTVFYAQHVVNSPVVNDRLREEIRRIIIKNIV